MNCGVYRITNLVNGKTYVGSACSFRQRWNEHRSLLARGKHHSPHLQRSYARHGLEGFTFEKLIVCARADLLLYEQRAIDALKPEYNACRTAGSTFGRKHSDETKAKIRAKALGRKYSAETIELRASKLRGIPLPPERIAHLLGNQHAKGYRPSPERLASMSAAMLGQKRPKSPEHRAKISAGLKGIPHSPERRAKQAAAQREVPRGARKPKDLQ